MIQIRVSVLILMVFCSPTNALYAEATVGTKLCIHSRYISGPGAKSATNGHASITIEHAGREIQSWGFYPEGLRTNYFSDGEFDKSMIENYLMAWTNDSESSPIHFQQAKLCKPISEADAVRAKTFAEAYSSRFGAWNQYSNNCVHFAKFLFEQVTKEEFLLPIPQPVLLHAYIKAADTSEKEARQSDPLFLERDLATAE